MILVYIHVPRGERERILSVLSFLIALRTLSLSPHDARKPIFLFVLLFEIIAVWNIY